MAVCYLFHFIFDGKFLRIGIVVIACMSNYYVHVVVRISSCSQLIEEGMSNYNKLKQLFAPNTATGHLQISSNIPALNSDEKRVLKEELANNGVPTHLDDNCYTPN